MTIRIGIATVLLATTCAAQADVIPSAAGANIVSGSQVAGAIEGASMIAGVTHGSDGDILVQALYERLNTAFGSNMKVSMKKGVDGVYMTGLSAAKAAALAGDGMSVIMTPDGYKIVPYASNVASGGGAGGGYANGGGNWGGSGGSSGASYGGGGGTSGGGAGGGNGGSGGGSSGTGTGGMTVTLPVNVPVVNTGNSGVVFDTSPGTRVAPQAAVAVPEPSTIALLLAGVAGAVGIRRRRPS